MSQEESTRVVFRAKKLNPRIIETSDFLRGFELGRAVADERRRRRDHPDDVHPPEAAPE